MTGWSSMNKTQGKVPLDISKKNTQFPPMDAPVYPLTAKEITSAIHRISSFIAAHDKPDKTPTVPKSTKKEKEQESSDDSSSAKKAFPLIGEFFSAQEVSRIIGHASLIFKKEPTLLKITFPLNASMPATSSRREGGSRELMVVGDIHGSIRELMNIFDQYGPPPVTNYLFLGDYVDRGKESLAVVLYLFLMKIRWPNHIFMLRGNHESFLVTSIYGFRAECKIHFADESIFGLMNIAFMYLPLAAIIHNCAFCCHGGVSQWMTSRDSISAIMRPALFERLTLQEHLIATDIMWADPKRFIEGRFFPSLMRGCGFCFNKEGLQQVLSNLRCSLLIRGHESKKNGVETMFDGLVITVHTTVIAGMEAGGVLRLSVTTDGSKLMTEPITLPRTRIPKLTFIMGRITFYHELYKKSFSKKSIRQVDLRPILMKLDDDRFFRRNIAGQDEIFLWVQSHCGSLFDEFLTKTGCRRPKAVALRLFPALLSVSFGKKPDCIEDYGVESAKFIVKFSKYCSQQRAKGLLTDEDIDCLVIADDKRKNNNQSRMMSAIEKYRLMKEKEKVEEIDVASDPKYQSMSKSSSSSMDGKRTKEALAVEPASLPRLTEEDIGRGAVKLSATSRKRHMARRKQRQAIATATTSTNTTDDDDDVVPPKNQEKKKDPKEQHRSGANKEKGSVTDLAKKAGNRPRPVQPSSTMEDEKSSSSSESLR